MNTNTKHCAYKGCGNTSTRDGHLTFFGFPLKNAEKCRQWAALAGTDIPSSKPLYLCEAHFNPIFLSRTPRRTVLLPKAVPYAYNSDEPEYVEKDLSTEDLANSVAIIYDALEAEGVEEISTDAQLKIKDVVENHVESSDSSAFGNASKIEKRSSFDTSQLNCNNVTKRQKIHAGPEAGASVSNGCVIDNTVANPDIVTFIFRGEEYIQMPKSIYLQQRSELDAELRKYKKMVESIKRVIQSWVFYPLALPIQLSLLLRLFGRYLFIQYSVFCIVHNTLTCLHWDCVALSKSNQINH